MKKILGISCCLLLMFVAIAGAAPASYTLPGDNAFPEGIGLQQNSRHFFVGSVTSGAVMIGHVNSTNVEVFLPGGGDNRTDVRGVKADNRGRLFLAGGATGQIFVYDIGTKKLLGKMATNVTPSFVNDVTVAASGNAYFTDSRSPYIYRVKTNKDGSLEFKNWLNVGSTIIYGEGFNLNGIAVTSDESALLVIQSNTGKLYRVDVSSQKITQVDLGGVMLNNGDGLWLKGSTLYVMRNADKLLVKIAMSDKFHKGKVVNTWTHAALDFPTTFALDGNNLLIVNSQLNKMRTGEKPVLPFSILNLTFDSLMPKL